MHNKQMTISNSSTQCPKRFIKNTLNILGGEI